MVAPSESHEGRTPQAKRENQVRRLPRDPHNTGPATESRTHFEKEAVALAIIRAWLHDDDLAGVAVQHSADVILIHHHRPPTIVSIKHREPHQSSGDSGWSWSALQKQDVLRSLYDWWRDSGRWCAIEFWSNSGFVGPCRDLHAACSAAAAPTADVIQRTAKQLGTSSTDAADFLHALSIPTEPLPRRKEIAVHGVDEMRRVLEQYRPNAALYAERCYLRLVEHIVTLGRDGPANGQPGPTRCRARSLDDLDLGDRSDLESQYLDLSDLKHLVLVKFDQLSGAELPDLGHRWEADPRFTGRRTELKQLAVLLQPGGTDPITPVVIHGLAGSGKTSLATQFAAQHSNALRPIFVSAGSRPAVVDALRRLAPSWDEQTWQSGLAEAGAPVTPPLPGTSATLLILDGVDDAEIVRGLIPRRSLCRVLITSRVRDLDDAFAGIELGGWERSDSRTYLQGVLPSETHHNCDGLADALHDHPLGLVQAATHCTLLGRSIAQFTDILNNAPLDALELGRTCGYPGSLIEAIRLNIAEATDRDPAARDLLTLLAHLGPAPLAESVFDRERMVAFVMPPRPAPRLRKRWWRNAKYQQREWLRAQKSALSQYAPTADTIDVATRIWNRSSRDRAIETLLRLSLITLRGRAFVVHPIVAIVARHEAKDLRTWVEVGLGLFVQTHETDDARQELLLDQNLEHIATLTVTALDNGFHGVPVIELASDLAVRLSFLGVASSTVVPGWTAMDLGRRSVDLAIAQLDAQVDVSQPPWKLFLVAQRYKFAQVLVQAGHTDEAISLLQQNAEAGEELGRFYTWINAIRDLAAIAVGTGRPALAEDILRKIEAIPADLDIDIAHRLATAHAQTGLLRMLNRIDEAYDVNIWALRQLDVIENLPLAVRSLIHEDASLLARDRNDPSVLNHLTAALDVQRARQRNGARPDWHLVNALRACGDGAVDVGNYDLARELLSEAEDLARREFGANSEAHAIVLAARGRLRFVTATPRHAHADMHRALADLTTAVEVLRSGSDDSRKFLPAALVHLAQVEGHLGHSATAIELAREAYHLDLRTFGPNHVETLKDAALINNLETMEMIFSRIYE